MGRLDGRAVTVLGAGVAGLALARALALRGAEVTVLEQAEAIREVGAGLQITPNGAAVLRALGLDTALDAASLPAASAEVEHERRVAVFDLVETNSFEPVGAGTWYPVNDVPTDKASYRFTVTVPKPYTAVANGIPATA